MKGELPFALHSPNFEAPLGQVLHTDTLGILSLKAIRIRIANHTCFLGNVARIIEIIGIIGLLLRAH